MALPLCAMLGEDEPGIHSSFRSFGWEGRRKGACETKGGVHWFCLLFPGVCKGHGKGPLAGQGK